MIADFGEAFHRRRLLTFRLTETKEEYKNPDPMFPLLLHAQNHNNECLIENKPNQCDDELVHDRLVEHRVDGRLDDELLVLSERHARLEERRLARAAELEARRGRRHRRLHIGV